MLQGLLALFFGVIKEIKMNLSNVDARALPAAIKLIAVSKMVGLSQNGLVLALLALAALMTCLPILQTGDTVRDGATGLIYAAIAIFDSALSTTRLPRIDMERAEDETDRELRAIIVLVGVVLTVLFGVIVMSSYHVSASIPSCMLLLVAVYLSFIPSSREVAGEAAA